MGSALAGHGDKPAACEAAERAVAEAASARLLWLVMLSLRDLLRWCELREAAAVRSRLRGVVGRLAATTEEVTAVLGQGVL